MISLWISLFLMNAYVRFRKSSETNIKTKAVIRIISNTVTSGADMPSSCETAEIYRESWKPKGSEEGSESAAEKIGSTGSEATPEDSAVEDETSSGARTDVFDEASGTTDFDETT